MAPKKAVPVKGQSVKAETTQCGLFSEACTLPLWDDEENARETWGDLNATGQVDPNTLFADPDWAHPHVAAFGPWLADWKRPSAIFSPFKPVVYRPVLSVNPYEWDPSKADGMIPTSPSAASANQDEEDQPKLTSKIEVIAHYRAMKPVRLHAADDAPASDLLSNMSMVGTPQRRNPKKGGGKAQASTPLFMRVLNSALMVINQCQHLIPQGQYAWELIYPQNPTTGFPMYNPSGKYVVKLFFGGAFRRVVVDDRFPTDANGQCMLTVTEQKEVWPALLAKAMMKALGPQHETLLFRNPSWVVSTLLGGWVPQVLSPGSEELLTLKAIRTAMAIRHGPGVIGDPILIATCGDSTEADLPIQDTEDHYVTHAGFHPNQAFHLLDMRPHHNTSLLRLCAPGAAWKGQFHYASNSWNEVESFINFTQNDRNQLDLSRKWNDFWMPWEQFAKYFKSIVVLRKVAEERRFATYRQITCPPDVVVPEVKAAAKGAPVPTHPPVERGLPKNVVKWLHINSEVPATLLVNYVGLAKLKEKDGATVPIPPTTVTVHNYNWTKSVPFNVIGRLKVNHMTSQSMMINVPAGPCAYRFTVDSLPQDCAVSIMGPIDMVLGEEREVCKDLLDITSSSDAGVYNECKADFTTIWFKRSITVKQPTRCNFLLSTLPKGTDVAAHRSVTQDTAAAGKGKAPAKPAKVGGKDVPVNDTAQEEIDDGSTHPFPIMNFASLTILNMDTGAVVCSDTIGKILGVSLAPNKAGYTIVGCATPPESYGKGLWKLSCTADRPFETFEPRYFDEVVSRAGEYAHNDVSSLMRYNFTVGEAATASIQVRVKEALGIPFTLELFHNDKSLEKRTGVKSSFLHHLSLIPAADKSAVSVYSLHVTLDSGYTQTWEEKRREHVVIQFEKDCDEQEQHMLRQQAELREALKRDPTSSAAPEFSGPRPGSVASQSTNIAYTLTIASSTPKVDIKEDNSITEQLTAVKASWSRGKDDVPAETKGKAAPKPAKGQPVVDEATVRFQKAKESRDKFLCNRKGVFMPFAAQGKLVLYPEEEPGARMVAMTPLRPLDAATRLHQGVPAGGGVNHGGITHSANAASAEVEIPQRPVSLKLIETVQAQCAARKETRKQLHSDLHDKTSAFWGILKPDAKTEVEPDEGRRKSTKPKK